MSDRYFVDTNLLVYARDATLPDKQARAAQWLERLWELRAGRLSVQVLQEYYVTVTSKLALGLSAVEARDDVRALMTWEPLAIDGHVMEAAWRVQDRFRRPVIWTSFGAVDTFGQPSAIRVIERL